MEILRKLVNFAALLFILIAALVLFNIIGVTYLDGNFTNFNPENFYYAMFAIATILLVLYLLVTNLHTLTLKRNLTLAENRINELKAKLYDHKVEENRISGAVRPTPTDIPPLTPPTQSPDNF